MTKKDKEIELKLQIKNKAYVAKLLKKLGAKLTSQKDQTDILFNSKYFDFGDYDQALRLRREKTGTKEVALLAFKGTPTFSKSGHKTRDEYETEVDFDQARKLVNSIGFKEVVVIKKKRESWKWKALDIEIDEAKFGTFIEFEGTPEDIEEVRVKLGLEKATPVKEGYVFLQEKWEKKHK